MALVSIRNEGIFLSNMVLGVEYSPVSPEFQAAQFMPDLMEDREIARIEARAILEHNRQLLRDGEFDAVPIPVDPLSTADLVIEAREKYGKGSIEHKTAEQALELDCHRLLLEAVRAKTWEYFPKSQQEYDPGTGYYYSHGYAIATIVDNGLSPVSEAEEVDRRLNEAVEERTYMSIGRRLLGNTVEVNPVPEIVNVATISPCTNWALQRYKDGKTDGFGGYVPSKDRRMIRNVRFDSTLGYREEDQIGASGDYWDDDVISDSLHILDSRLEGVDMDRTYVHGTQMVTNREIGVWDYAELFDILASKKHGVTIFMGELVEDGHPRDYEAAKLEAARRQAETLAASQSLAGDILVLAESGIDHWAANAFVEELVKKEMLTICEAEPEKAAEMFDEATVDGLKEVQRLISIGDDVAAQLLRKQVEFNAPRPEFCGAGSCGLESVDPNSAEGKELYKKVGAEEGDIVLRDVVRACDECGKKGGVIYAFVRRKEDTQGKSKVNKYCQNCEAFEHKMTKDGK